MWALLLVAPGLVAGCSQQDVDRWNQFWAASQPASQPATAPQDAEGEPIDELSRVRLQRDRLLAANRLLERDLEGCRLRQAEWAARALELERRLREQSTELESRRRELQQNLETLQRSRDEWEVMLADRQRQIDILANRAQRLEQELEKLRRERSGP